MVICQRNSAPRYALKQIHKELRKFDNAGLIASKAGKRNLHLTKNFPQNIFSPEAPPHLCHAHERVPGTGTKRDGKISNSI